VLYTSLLLIKLSHANYANGINREAAFARLFSYAALPATRYLFLQGIEFRCSQGVLAMPNFQYGGFEGERGYRDSDFNDLARLLKDRGRDAVKACIDAAALVEPKAEEPHANGKQTFESILGAIKAAPENQVYELLLQLVPGAGLSAVQERQLIKLVKERCPDLDLRDIKRDLKDAKAKYAQAHERESFAALHEEGKPLLHVVAESPDKTVAALRDILSKEDSGLYDRGAIVTRLAKEEEGTITQPLTPELIMLTAHQMCRPWHFGTYGADACKLPREVAIMYRDWMGEWRLPLLFGITCSPLLRNDGTIICSQGYDPVSKLWCENVPDIGPLVPAQPTNEQAQKALTVIRETFKMFCFADAETVDAGPITVVDLNLTSALDESSFLAALTTAVC
jgi:hypothetical protein